MSDDSALLELHAKLKALHEDRKRNKLEQYDPYPKQLEFHKLGASKDERLLSAGNQLGKTVAGAHEAAFHLTGRYPGWWPGRRWDRPVRAWVAGESSTAVRDTIQKLLMGDVSAGMENLGTGIVPADAILDYSWTRGVAQGMDTVVVKHSTGGKSVLKFKGYEQAREKWQGDTIDFVWFDEEPPLDIYTEGLARFTATKGMAYMTFTPLKGMSNVVRRFKQEANERRGEVIMTARDAKHIDEDALKAMLSKYPEHEHDTRINGIPMMGEGRIFNIADSVIMCEPFEIPGYWPRIIGLDVGHGDHPTAAVWCALDRDADVLYVVGEYSMKGGNIPTHASALKSRGRIKVAWPQDAHQGDKFSGVAVSAHYKAEDVDMLTGPAKWPDGSNSVWHGITLLQQRMESNRFKVFKTCSKWFEEFRNYHQENGKIVDLNDDLLAATRYALMMLRYAKTVDTTWRPGVSKPVVRVAPGTDFNPFTGR